MFVNLLISKNFKSLSENQIHDVTALTHCFTITMIITLSCTYYMLKLYVIYNNSSTNILGRVRLKYKWILAKNGQIMFSPSRSLASSSLHVPGVKFQKKWNKAGRNSLISQYQLIHMCWCHGWNGKYRVWHTLYS